MSSRGSLSMNTRQASQLAGVLGTLSGALTCFMEAICGVNTDSRRRPAHSERSGTQEAIGSWWRRWRFHQVSAVPTGARLQNAHSAAGACIQLVLPRIAVAASGGRRAAAQQASRGAAHVRSCTHTRMRCAAQADTLAVHPQPPTARTCNHPQPVAAVAVGRSQHAAPHPGG